MIEMGIDPALMRLALRYDSDDMRYLSLREMELFRVVARGDRPEATEPADIPSAPPKIQADPRFDACGANGVVAGLDPSEEGFLAVRGGPGTQYGEIDRLHNGEQVYLCSERGKWLSVVYSKQRQNCDAPTPPSHSGACGVGWVHRNWIRQNEPSDMPPPGSERRSKQDASDCRRLRKRVFNSILFAWRHNVSISGLGRQSRCSAVLWQWRRTPLSLY